MNEKIPFNKPFIIGKELEYITQAVEAGQASCELLIVEC